MFPDQPHSIQSTASPGLRNKPAAGPPAFKPGACLIHVNLVRQCHIPVTTVQDPRTRGATICPSHNQSGVAAALGRALQNTVVLPNSGPGIHPHCRQESLKQRQCASPSLRSTQPNHRANRPSVQPPNRHTDVTPATAAPVPRESRRPKSNHTPVPLHNSALQPFTTRITKTPLQSRDLSGESEQDGMAPATAMAMKRTGRIRIVRHSTRAPVTGLERAGQPSVGKGPMGLENNHQES